MTLLLLPFQFYLDSFSFSFLIVVPRTSTSMLKKKKSGKSGILVLFLIFQEMLPAFHHWLWCCLLFVIHGLYHIEVCSFYAHFVKSFYHKRMLNFVRSFCCIYGDDHMVFILRLVNMVYYVDWFVDTEPSMHSWAKSYLIMVYDPF